jgi:hypothetical protein
MDYYRKATARGDLPKDKYRKWREDNKELLTSGLMAYADTTEKRLRKLRKRLKDLRKRDADAAVIKGVEKQILDAQIRFNTRYNKTTLDKGWIKSMLE